MKEKREIKDAFIIFSLGGAIVTLVFLVYTSGNGFRLLFHADSIDTGMDFFHSIEYTKGHAPYEKFGTLYPPLANLFFSVLFMFVPQWQYEKWGETFQEGIALRGTSADSRIWQPTMILFILFVSITTMILFITFQTCMKNVKDNRIIALLLVFSYPVIYAFERGNIILFSVILCMFYLMYFDSSNNVLKEMALIALALSAGLKIYPAIFGILLIYNRQWKDAIRTILYGIISFFLPFFAFKERLGGLPIFLHQLFKFGQTTELTCAGTSFDRMLNSAVYLFSKLFNISINGSRIMRYTRISNYVVVIILLLLGMMLRERWKQVLICAISIILFSSQGIYILNFMLCPLALCIRNEKNLNKENFGFLFGMIGMIIFLPLALVSDGLIVPQYLRIHIFMWILLICLGCSIVDEGRKMRRRF